jgi:hypothetical protein
VGRSAVQFVQARVPPPAALTKISDSRIEEPLMVRKHAMRPKMHGTAPVYVGLTVLFMRRYSVIVSEPDSKVQTHFCGPIRST